MIKEAVKKLAKSLRGEEGQIRGSAKKQREYLNPDKWRDNKRFKGATLNTLKEIVCERLDAEDGSGKKIIRRECVFGIADKVGKGKDRETPLRKVFLGSMVWGHGKVGYGPYRVGKIMENSSNLSSAIRESYDHVKSGDIEGAYNAFDASYKTKGLGQSFFTKYLYFIGKGSKPRRPLVLDNVMIRALESRDVWQEIEDFADSEKRKDSKKRKAALRYRGYVEVLNDCAKELKVSPDDLECFLFEKQLEKEKGK